MKTTNTPVLKTKNLKIGYKTKGKFKVVADNINLELENGQLICLLGPNGAGKSTLIKTLSGIQLPISGEISLSGNDFLKLSPLEIAHQLSVVLTERIETDILVYDLVALGRASYTGWAGRLSVIDKEKINWAIEMTGIKKHINKKIHELSDGERQKIMIARAFAQDTPLIILDEPTAHLDLPNRVEIFRLLRKLAHDTNKAIILSTHELDFALQAADKIWLMEPMGELKTGIPEDLVINGTFESVFRKDGLEFDRNTGTFLFHHPGKNPIELVGNGALAFWTQKALERKGFKVTNDVNTGRRINIIEEDNGLHKWTSAIGNTQNHHNSIDELIQFLTQNN